MLSDKIEKRIEEGARPHYGSWFKDNNAPYYIEGATTIATELYEHIKELRGALGFECGNRCAHQNPCNAKEALQSSIEKWGDDKEIK